MKKINILILQMILAMATAHAQSNPESNDHSLYELCHTHLKEALMMKSDKKQKALSEEYELKYQQFIKSGQKKNKNKKNILYTLPVVVHIIHPGSAMGSDENPSDAQIRSSILASSERFRHMQAGANTYTNPNYGADTEIELCIATKDPSGNNTSGIIRYLDPINTIDPSLDYLNSIEWDDSKYLNIFIAKDIGGPCGYYQGGIYDFTVYLASCYNPGLVAHELGHHFSLNHTFIGCENDDCTADGDRVCDTPPKGNSGSNGFTCDTPGDDCNTDENDTSANNPYRATALGGLGNQPDMLENFMDYTGNCWDSFTEGQKSRMRFNLDNTRVDLINNNNACIPIPLFSHDTGIAGINIQQEEICVGEVDVDFTLSNYGSATINGVIIEMKINEVIVWSQNWTGSLQSTMSITINIPNVISLESGQNLIEISTSLPNGQIDENQNNDSDFNSILSIAPCDFSIPQSCTDMNTNTEAGPGNTTLVNLTGSYPTEAGTINVCVSVEGDNNFFSETFDVYDESNVLIGRTNFGQDCDGQSPLNCIELSLNNYQNWIIDDVITITFDPISTDINPQLCNTNQVCAELYIRESTGCPPEYSENNGNNLTGPQNTNALFETNGIMQSNQVINANVDYRSGISIEMLEGFEVKVNRIFSAIIGGCDN